MITQLETNLTHAWGATRNLNFGISRLLNVSLCTIAANSAKLLKISPTLENSREEWKMLSREETETSKKN